MRIAQVTLKGYFNYGNILQKFALNHALKKFADTAEVLCLDGNSLFSETGDGSKAQCVLFKERHDWERIFHLREAVRQSKFKDFENLHISTRFNFPYFEDIAEEYDFFVIGSDQVWNPRWNPPYIFFEFVPREKKSLTQRASAIRPFPMKRKSFSDEAFPISITFLCAKKMRQHLSRISREKIRPWYLIQYFC